MALYTVIMDYDGGTYISQVNSPDVRSARFEWANSLDLAPIEGWAEAQRAELLDDLADSDPMPLDGLKNAWATSSLVGDTLALIHLVETAQ